jgi:cobalt-zinc-cadmium efflux system outer membrane protein
MRRSLYVVLCALPLAAGAQTPVTESEAVRLGLSRAELSDLTRATVEAAEAEVLVAGQIPNPTLSYAREQTRGTPRTAEHALQLSQTFDVAGRRELHREAAVRRAEAAAASASARRAEITAEVRRRFYEALLKQELIRSTQTWVERFMRIEAIVHKRLRTGEASGYDHRRLSRERESAQARLAVEAAELDRARARLAALIGNPDPPVSAVSGVLLPPEPEPITTALARLEQRPDFRALLGRAEAAELEGRAARPGQLPDLTVGIGPKWIDNGVTRENGVMLSFAIPLPIYERGQAARKRAAAEALGLRADYRLARDRAEGELRGLHQQMQRLLATARAFRARVTATTPELLRIAESAYQGGESTILELLDAYRGALDSEVTALDLEWKAREARIEYDLHSGGSVN